MINIKFLLAICLLFPALASAQLDFRYDDDVYKTLYIQDLCGFLEANPKTLLLDVRSPGEFNDKAQNAIYNIGHLKGAMNISIDSIDNKIKSLQSKSENPIVVYCSHSQRSRVVSKKLTENGFTKVWNLNGGMTLFNQASPGDVPCKKEMIVSGLPYKNIPANEVSALIANTKNMQIFDMRTNAEYDGKDTIQSQNIGRITGANNVPAARLTEYLAKMDANKVTLVYDGNGKDSNDAAKYLSEHGYKNVYHLMGGLSAVIGRDKETLEIRKELLVGTPEYTILNSYEAINLLTKKSNAYIIDARKTEEFKNKSTDHWRNLGHIKNAVNIPPSEFQRQKEELLKHKKETIVVYGENAAKYCAELKKMGFEEVNLVYGGLWDLVSASFNIKSLKDSKALFVDHKGLY